MDTDTIHTCRLSEDELGQFTRMHRRMLPIRNKNFKTLHIKNKQIKDNLQPILDKSFSVLRSNNIDDFDNTTYHMEFHQRNCGFEKKKSVHGLTGTKMTVQQLVTGCILFCFISGKISL